MPLLIAVDGPVGAGKSTISDEVARRLHILHLDTGAMYRAVGLKALREGISLDDEDALTALAKNALVAVQYVDGAQQTYLDGENVSGAIRSQEAGQAASAVSRFSGVRRAMVARQRAMAEKTDMLLDGRDIGTVVLKDAPVKIYLTASVEARAKRRMAQLKQKGQDAVYEDILNEVSARDAQDMNRAVDPLRKAADAVTVDSSELTFEETVQRILDIVEAKTHGRQ